MLIIMYHGTDADDDQDDYGDYYDSGNSQIMIMRKGMKTLISN